MDSVEVRSFIFMLKLFTLLLIAIFLAVFVGCIWFLVSIIYSFFSYERQIQVHVPVSNGLFSPAKLRKLQDDYNRTCRENDCDLERGERRPVSVSVSVSKSRVVKSLVSLVNRLRCAFKAGIH